MGEQQTIVPGDFCCPKGTIHVVIGDDDTVMRVYAQTYVDPYDWNVVLHVLKLFQVYDPEFNGPIWNRDIDVWEVQLPRRVVTA